MSLIPSERAVLKIIRMLVLETSTVTYRVASLRGRWPAAHSQAYSDGFDRLVSKGLLSVSPDGVLLSVTNAGIKMMAALR